MTNSIVDNDKINLSTRKLIAIFLLILTTVLWGTSFILTKNITQDVPIFLYLGIRFSIALCGYIPFILHIKRLNKKIIFMGFITGILFFFGMAFQTTGLQSTTAGKAGFITGLSTIMIPFLAWFVYKKPMSLRIWIAVTLSVIGMAFLFLEGETTGGIIIGDMLILICAFFFAFYIILNDKYVRLSDVFLYSMIQMFVISISSFIVSFFLKESYDIFSMPLTSWIIMIYLGTGVMALAFVFQNWSQQFLDPTTVAIIFTLESVFAALFGFLIGNEVLTMFGWIGCGLIFAAILITVLKNTNINRKNL